jgi:CelD/BcsL family acetyltransferase involved in cellulose biosynthesis
LRPIAEEALTDGRAPLVAVARGADGRPAAGIALSVAAIGRGPLRARLGSWLGHPRRVYQPDLLAPGGDRAAAAVLAAALARVDGLVLHDAPAGGGAARAVAATAPWAWRGEGRPSLVLPAAEAALARRRRDVAYEVRRARGRGAEVSVSVHAAPGEVAGALEILLDLHRRRWEGRVDVSGFSRDEGDRRLHRRAIPAAAATGMVRLTVVREDGAPVAAVAGLVAGGGGMLYRTAAVPGPVLRGPGIVAIVATIDALVAAGARRVDLGIGQEMHKRKLSPASEPSDILVVARRRLAQPALTAAVEGRRVARDRLRSTRRRVAGWRSRGARASASGRSG